VQRRGRFRSQAREGCGSLSTIFFFQRRRSGESQGRRGRALREDIISLMGISQVSPPFITLKRRVLECLNLVEIFQKHMFRDLCIVPRHSVGQCYIGMLRLCCTGDKPTRGRGPSSTSSNADAGTGMYVIIEIGATKCIVGDLMR
jgi:hypothetical protein